MQIAGVQGGANRGNLIQSSAHEKAERAARLAVAAYDGFSGKIVILDKLTIKDVTAATAGDKLRGEYENRTYHGVGYASFWLRDKVQDTVKVPVSHEFTVDFHDTLDPANGLPDVAVDAFQLA